MTSFDWENLAQNNVAIGSELVFEALCDYFPISDVELYMFDLAEQNTIQFYVGNSSYIVQHTSRSGDFYIVL